MKKQIRSYKHDREFLSSLFVYYCAALLVCILPVPCINELRVQVSQLI